MKRTTLSPSGRLTTRKLRLHQETVRTLSALTERELRQVVAGDMGSQDSTCLDVICPEYMP
jgi:hypothetical protein